MGPVVCGLYCCALSALDNRSFGMAEANRGWKSAGSSMAASLFINYALYVGMLFKMPICFTIIASA